MSTGASPSTVTPARRKRAKRDHAARPAAAGETARPAPAKEVKLVGAVAAATKILRHLSTAPAPIGVVQLARELRLNPSTCFNILKTLVHEDLVELDPRTKTYAISLGVIELAKRALAQSSELRILEPQMKQVAQAHAVTVTLWRRISDDRMMLVTAAESDAATRISLTIGTRVPLLLGAMGRVMAANIELPEEELRRRFNALRWHRPIDFESFLEQVEETRQSGWAIDDGYYHRGTLTVSAPVLTKTGEVNMCCSATMFSGQHDPKRVTQIATEIVAIGRSIL
ncbi:MAG: IclR family transcriptional regulator [Rhodospirillales bacterium]|nr:IclR family transcriptional regulator [Rhodospirillales bacterium]